LAVEVLSLWRGEPVMIARLDARVVVGALGLLWLMTGVMDAFAIRRLAAPTIRRVLPLSLSLKAWSEVVIEIRSSMPLGEGAELIDGIPTEAEFEGLPLRLIGGTAEKQRGRYRLKPLARGDACFARPTLRAESPFRFWRYTARLGDEANVRVFPNFAATSRFDELVTSARTREVGIKCRQRRGEGLEFHQLREYRAGDTIRQIDWKATSRKRELISREYEDERDQRIVFMMDCSRRMRTKDGEVSHFDHSLNAMILLAHVALKGGDAVGLLSFGEDRRWVPPCKGAASVNRLLHQVYDLEPTTLGVDFRGAAEELVRLQRRRSMVVLLTHLRREDLVDLLPAIRLMRRKHYVLVVDLRQLELDELLACDPGNLADAFTAMGAWRNDIERREVHEHLRSEGVLSLDATPEQLGPALVSRYYEVKKAGAL
jgi:uncharacterized protein (DUF58 family)